MWQVYGSAEVPITESTPTGAGITNAYGRTKYMIEEILKVNWIYQNLGSDMVGASVALVRAEERCDGYDIFQCAITVGCCRSISVCDEFPLLYAAAH